MKIFKILKKKRILKKKIKVNLGNLGENLTNFGKVSR